MSCHMDSSPLPVDAPLALATSGQSPDCQCFSCVHVCRSHSHRSGSRSVMSWICARVHLIRFVWQDGVKRVMEAAILQQGDPVEVTHGEQATWPCSTHNPHWSLTDDRALLLFSSSRCLLAGAPSLRGIARCRALDAGNRKLGRP